MHCTSCGQIASEGQKFCVHCGSSLTSERRADVTAKPPRRGKRWITVFGLVAVLTAGLVYFGLTLTRNYHPVIADQPSTGFGTEPGNNRVDSRLITAAIEGTDIIVPVDAVVKSGIVRFYDPEGVQSVPVLAYITPRGKIVTAMSLSESCRSDDFYLEGHTIHCAHCPSYWHMESLEAYACCQKYYPDPVASTVERGLLRIPARTVREWRARI